MSAQVTIGSNKVPYNFSILEVISSNENTGGLRLPQLTSDERTALQAEFLVEPQKTGSEGLIIYNKTINQIEYWNGEKWIAMKLSTEPWMVSGSTNTEATSNTDNIYQMGQVTIGSTATNDNAALNVVATDKGVLLPRIALTGPKDKTTIPDPTSGMLVYNTGDNAGMSVAGYVYWNGQEWRVVSTSTSVAANATLVCGQAKLDPEQVISGGNEISVGTVLKIPYTVGNGGMYNGVTIKSTDPASTVEAIISDGQFENGSGYLAFYVSGIPSASETTPAGVTFDLTPFYDENPSITAGCATVTVGTEVKADIISVAVMDNLKLVYDNGMEAYSTQLTTPDGIFSVRAVIGSRAKGGGYFGLDSNRGMNLQIRNNTNGEVTIAQQVNWQFEAAHGGNNNNKLILKPGVWSGDQESNAAGPVYASYVDGSAINDCPTIDAVNRTNKCKFPYWGNAGVYAASKPERRTYSWTINDGAVHKTAYIMTFSSSAMEPNDYPTSVPGPAGTWPITCPNGICTGTKFFIKIDQITAP